MNFSFSKKQKNIEKPKDEVQTRKVWIRLYTIFTILHFAALLGLSYFFRELIRGIDEPVQGVPQTQLPTLNTLESRLSAVETRVQTKTHSLLAEIKEEEKAKVSPGSSVSPQKPVR